MNDYDYFKVDVAYLYLDTRKCSGKKCNTYIRLTKDYYYVKPFNKLEKLYNSIFGIYGPMQLEMKYLCKTCERDYKISIINNK